ncbi:uncharacterized protein LOC112345800 [Selaginella moellendorffii]|uniref:uncharacterized protein LOC112345800 n=1 Tax=Selaginella moellendorffii TaxID=88036 RepID=UPI000D1CB322|nr:uncharacterized protein LOC112345800 [Selaginella moellendorffii]|eukprot:XP_024529023.1 uncharacterized protein LOC112345800 [Selaginella moellendorffii]
MASTQQEKVPAAAAEQQHKRKFPISLPDVRGSRSRPKFWLEMFKFSVYVTIPVVLIFGFSAGSDALNWAIRNRSYVVYPPQNSKPLPPPEFFMEVARRRREAREKAAKDL